MLVTIASLAFALQVGALAPDVREPSVQEIQYRVYALPPPCGHGWDLSARDGLCYPNGMLPPQDQAARRSFNAVGSPKGTATACSICSWFSRAAR